MNATRKRKRKPERSPRSNERPRFPGEFAAVRMAGFVLLALLAAGCASRTAEQRRVAAYRPDVGQRNLAEWAGAPGGTPRDAGDDNLIVRDEDADESTEYASGISAWSRVFRSGDRVVITLSGIPRPEERQDVIDDAGKVNLPFVGGIHIEGTTPSEAKRKIEQAYIDGGIYRSINVTIVAQEEEFFVQGEVRRPGRHPWRSGMTLSRAIGVAGGYTEFARRSNVQLTRKEKMTVYDMNRIESGQERDPLIEPGDTIVVRRRWFL